MTARQAVPSRLICADCGFSASVHYVNMADTCPRCKKSPFPELPYECPECGDGHDGMTTGTEYCPACQTDLDNKAADQ